MKTRQKPVSNDPTFSDDEVGKLAELSDRMEHICTIFDSAHGSDFPAHAIHGLLKPIDLELANVLREIRERTGEGGAQ